MNGPSSVETHSLTLSIAGLAVQLTGLTPALIPQLTARYQDFLAAGAAPGCTAQITITGSSLPALLEKTAHFKGPAVRFTHPGYQGQIDLRTGQAHLTLDSTHPIEDIDYFLRVIYALLVFRAGGLLFHAAGVVQEGLAYLFFGYSGSGKTTAAQLSLDAVVLNDDLLVLMPGADGWRAFGTPFWNPTQVQPEATSAPVVWLLRLVQSPDVRLEPLSPAQALAEVIASVPVISASPAHSAALLRRCQTLLSSVPAAALHFRKDTAFWDLLLDKRAPH